MSDISLQLPTQVFGMIGPYVQRIANTLDDTLAIDPHLPEDDQDGLVREFWLGDLKKHLKDDCAYLLEQLDQHLSKSGELKVSMGQAEAMLRACAAIRLRLRQSHLGGLSDNALETGEGIDPAAMDDQQKLAHFTFSVLAGLQELLIEALEG